MNTIFCRVCKKDIEQRADGSGGFELGFSKLFNTIEPWPVQILLCEDCFEKIAIAASIHPSEVSDIEKQTPMKKV